MNGLHAAISNTELAVLATPKDRPNQLWWLNNLGIMLLSWYN